MGAVTTLVDHVPTGHAGLLAVPPLDELPPIRPLDSPFATRTSPVTVATPSCCCSCCCCCLVTISGAVAYTAAASARQRRDAIAAGMGPGSALGGLLAFVALPLGLLVGFLTAQVAPLAGLIIAATMLTTATSFAVAMVLLGKEPGEAFGQGLLVAGISAAGIVLEGVLALVTVFLIELAIPFGIYIGIRWGAGGAEAPDQADVPWRHVSPPGAELPDAEVPGFGFEAPQVDAGARRDAEEVEGSGDDEAPRPGDP